MEYFEGQCLDSYVNTHECLSEEIAWIWMKKLLTTLTMLHLKGFAHRDLKPQNILINDDHEIKLIDFGISKKGKPIHREETPSEESKTENEFNFRFLTQVSTPNYAAPELLNQSIYTESIDIWGVGMILYTMLIGEIPSRVKTEESKGYTEEDHETFLESIDKNETLSPECKDLLKSILSYKGEDRPSAQSCLKHLWFAPSE